MNLLRSVENFVNMNRLASCFVTYSAVCRRCKVRCPISRAFSISFRSSASTTSVTNAAEKKEKNDPQSILKTKTVGTVEVDLPDARKQVSHKNSWSLSALPTLREGRVTSVFMYTPLCSRALSIRILGS